MVAVLSSMSAVLLDMYAMRHAGAVFGVLFSASPATSGAGGLVVRWRKRWARCKFWVSAITLACAGSVFRLAGEYRRSIMNKDAHGVEAIVAVGRSGAVGAGGHRRGSGAGARRYRDDVLNALASPVISPMPYVTELIYGR